MVKSELQFLQDNGFSELYQSYNPNMLTLSLWVNSLTINYTFDYGSRIITQEIAEITEYPGKVLTQSIVVDDIQQNLIEAKRYTRIYNRAMNLPLNITKGADRI